MVDRVYSLGDDKIPNFKDYLKIQSELLELFNAFPPHQLEKMQNFRFIPNEVKTIVIFLD